MPFSTGTGQVYVRVGESVRSRGETCLALRNLAEGELRDPVVFWKKTDALPTTKEEIPVSAIEAMEHLMPDARHLLPGGSSGCWGLGSLGLVF